MEAIRRMRAQALRVVALVLLCWLRQRLPATDLLALGRGLVLSLADILERILLGSHRGFSQSQSRMLQRLSQLPMRPRSKAR